MMCNFPDCTLRHTLSSFWPRCSSGICRPMLYLQGVDQPTIQINFSKNASMVSGPARPCLPA